MPWQVTLNEDTDNPDIVTALAEFWDASNVVVFSYARRLRFTVGDRNAFVSECKAALVTHNGKETARTNRAQQLTDALNA